MLNRGEVTPMETKLDLAGADGLRDDLLELSNELDRDQELEWGRIFSLPADKRAQELARVGRKHGCTQIVENSVVQ